MRSVFEMNFCCGGRAALRVSLIAAVLPTVSLAVVIAAALPTASLAATGCDLQNPTICWVESAYKTADITWQAVPGATAYWLGFSFADGSFAPLQKVEAPSTWINAQGPKALSARLIHGQVAGQKFFFAVRAVWETGDTYCESAWSRGFATPATMALATVTNLKVTKQAENAHLTWDPVSGADFYLVTRTKQSDLPGGWVTMAAVPAFLPEEWDDPVIYDGESYDYNVVAQSVPAGPMLGGTP